MTHNSHQLPLFFPLCFALLMSWLDLLWPCLLYVILDALDNNLFFFYPCSSMLVIALWIQNLLTFTNYNCASDSFSVLVYLVGE